MALLPLGCPEVSGGRPVSAGPTRAVTDGLKHHGGITGRARLLKLEQNASVRAAAASFRDKTYEPRVGKSFGSVLHFRGPDR